MKSGLSQRIQPETNNARRKYDSPQAIERLKTLNPEPSQPGPPIGFGLAPPIGGIGGAGGIGICGVGESVGPAGSPPGGIDVGGGKLRSTRGMEGFCVPYCE
jgi:hypothetical protein